MITPRDYTTHDVIRRVIPVQPFQPSAIINKCLPVFLLCCLMFAPAASHWQVALSCRPSANEQPPHHSPIPTVRPRRPIRNHLPTHASPVSPSLREEVCEPVHSLPKPGATSPFYLAPAASHWQVALSCRPSANEQPPHHSPISAVRPRRPIRNHLPTRASPVSPSLREEVGEPVHSLLEPGAVHRVTRDDLPRVAVDFIQR